MYICSLNSFSVETNHIHTKPIYRPLYAACKACTSLPTQPPSRFIMFVKSCIVLITAAPRINSCSYQGHDTHMISWALHAMHYPCPHTHVYIALLEPCHQRNAYLPNAIGLCLALIGPTPIYCLCFASFAHAHSTNYCKTNGICGL